MNPSDMPRARRPGFPGCALLCACLVLFFPGCSYSPDDSISTTRLDGDLSAPIQIRTDNFVRRQPPAVYVSPRAPLNRRPRALFVPLRGMQPMEQSYVSFSDLVSRQVWQVWLSLNIFEALAYAPEAGPFALGPAMAHAKMQGAELLVGGYINHFFDGGSGGESSVSLAIEIYDVKTGTLIWSLAQGGLMEARKTHDFYLFSVTERNPADPSGLITRSLAWDMGHVILGWVDPARANKGSLLDKLPGRQAF